MTISASDSGHSAAAEIDDAQSKVMSHLVKAELHLDQLKISSSSAGLIVCCVAGSHLEFVV
jgi:hypothetical protein